MNRKLVIICSLLYVLFMAVLAVFYYTNDESFQFLIAIGGVVCGAVPLLLALFTKLHFNLPLVISYLLFLFGSQYLGSILGWYGNGWWDTFLHVISGAILAFAGIALYERLIHRDAGREISPWFVFLFTFSFAVFGGVIWEIYEFSSDQLFGMTLQGGGNKDTMTDLIADAIGGLLIAVWSGIRTKINKHKQAV
ncbi:hypothetical protein ELQ35_13275 [Peribacillus cavernae]|uniref:Membrane-spanning protein n=1 Tax=Peribacillus cavernae TaxID=1674310 RepID=A0A3S0VXE9_9BACI|nr:hypothetical protein [Peribacillus cavernae]MDQ0217742.1 hypothetical protein [Peribacillus cavernae]RUQ28203.1 hypothetical protein ELQ35_13275 [Peribacillus cavernae]